MVYVHKETLDIEKCYVSFILFFLQLLYFFCYRPVKTGLNSKLGQVAQGHSSLKVSRDPTPSLGNLFPCLTTPIPSRNRPCWKCKLLPIVHVSEKSLPLFSTALHKKAEEYNEISPCTITSSLSPEWAEHTQLVQPLLMCQHCSPLTSLMATKSLDS